MKTPPDDFEQALQQLSLRELPANSRALVTKPAATRVSSLIEPCSAARASVLRSERLAPAESEILPPSATRIRPAATPLRDASSAIDPSAASETASGADRNDTVTP